MQTRLSKGYSLVELIMSMAISLMVLSFAVSLIMINTQFGALHLQQDYLRSQLLTVAQTISSEIQRAGFCFNCTNENPYVLQDKSNNRAIILIDDSASKNSGSCIRFAYNQNKTANPSLINKNDAKGFRLGKNAKGKAVIEIYENWQELTNWNCMSANGYAGYWQDMTTDNLSLEEFSFIRSVSKFENNESQILRLKISASLTNNKEIKDNLILDINVPNVANKP